MSYPWFLLSLLLTVTVWEDADADVDASFVGCAAAGLCCQGKNNTCRIGQPRNNTSNDDGNDDNSVFVASKRHSCFCDSACVDLADCCHDYLQTCPRKFSD